MQRPQTVGPDDIVFDRQGGFYFTISARGRRVVRDHGGLYYALPDGSKIVESVHPMLSPNGVGLSPDEKTVYVADTETSRLSPTTSRRPGFWVTSPSSPHTAGASSAGCRGFSA